MKTQEKNKSKSGIVIALLIIGLSVAIYSSISFYNERDYANNKRELERKEFVRIHEETLSEIEQNLAEIAAHEDVVRASFQAPNSENPIPIEQRINQEIEIIHALLEQNKLLINDLQTELGQSNSTIADLEFRNKSMQKKLNSFQLKLDEALAQNKELVASNEKFREENQALNDDLILAEKDNQYLRQLVESGDVAQQIKDEEIDALSKELNTTYYVVGDYKTLEELEVVEKNGGILGFGATKSLKTDFNQASFTAIDKNNYTTIPVYSKRAELATSHPSASYKWVENESGIQWLEITNPDAFWESSKYLVVLTEKGLLGQID